MKKILILALSAVLSLGMLTGCGGAADEPAGDEGVLEEAGLSGTVIIAGSTSVQPLSEELAAVFMEQNEDVKIEIQGGGSGVGINSAKDGVADIGAASRAITAEEEEGINAYIIAQDGIAVIVNPESTVEDLTMEQIKQIFVGEITDWSEVGGEAGAIVVVTREDGSGTRGAFTEITGVHDGDNDNTVATAIVQASTGAVKQTVASTPDTIGFISLGGIDDSIKTVKVEGAEPEGELVVSGEYKIARPFVYMTSGDGESDVVAAYIEFVMSAEGQAIVAEDFVPVN